MKGVFAVFIHSILLTLLFASTARSDFQKELILTKDNFHEELSAGEEERRIIIWYLGYHVPLLTA